MAKSILFIVLGFIAVGVTLMLSLKESETEPSAVYTEEEYEMLAEIIAKKGIEIAKQKVQAAGFDVNLAQGNVNGFLNNGHPNLSGTLEDTTRGGNYKVQVIQQSDKLVKIKSIGKISTATSEIAFYYPLYNPKEFFVVKDSSRLKINYVASFAGWCSAVFFQEYVPDSAENWEHKDPIMLFTSGKNRNGASFEPENLVLTPGTKFNILLGVDVDCSEQDKWLNAYDPSLFDTVHYSLQPGEAIADLQEGLQAIIDPNAHNDQQWRVAFEDMSEFHISTMKKRKKNGYYGSGWEFDENGYRITANSNSREPSFNDQVVEITLVKVE